MYLTNADLETKKQLKFSQTDLASRFVLAQPDSTIVKALPL